MHGVQAERALATALPQTTRHSRAVMRASHMKMAVTSHPNTVCTQSTHTVARTHLGDGAAPDNEAQEGGHDRLPHEDGGGTEARGGRPGAGRGGAHAGGDAGDQQRAQQRAGDAARDLLSCLGPGWLR